MTNPQLDKIS